MPTPIPVPARTDTKVSPIWFKILATMFSMGPALLVVASLLALELCSARYTLLKRMEQDSLSDYQALLVRNLVHGLLVCFIYLEVTME